MKNREFESLSKQYLLPDMPGYVIKGKLLFRTPIGLILHGFCFEPSEWDKSRFRIEVMVQPLYVTEDHLVFLISHDFGVISEKNKAQQWWNMDNGEKNVMADVRKRMLTVGVKWLSQYASPYDIVLKAQREWPFDDPYLLRAIAYSWIICGREREADEAIMKIHMIFNSLDTWYPWMHKFSDEVTMISKLLHKDVEKAKEQLMIFRNYTIAKLGLEKWSSEIIQGGER